jgi:hypothetical protein
MSSIIDFKKLDGFMEDNDWLKSDHCAVCGGIGFIVKPFGKTGVLDYEDQCESCEELHYQEVRADRLQDEWKGN